MEGGSYSNSRSLKQGIWGLCPLRSYVVTLFFKEQNDANHKICITHSHNVVKLTKDVQISWLGVLWVEPIIRYRQFDVLVQNIILNGISYSA